MTTSIFLAKLIGPLALALGLGILFNRDAVRAVLDEFVRNRAVLFLAGIISFPTGLAVILTHNVWVADWPVIVTLLGWLAVITGAVRIFAPDRATKFAKKVLSYNFTMGAAAFWVIVGAALCYFGFRSGVTA